MPKISSVGKNIKKSKNTNKMGHINRVNQVSKKKVNNEILENLLSAFDRKEILKAEVFLNKLDKIDLNQVDLTVASNVSRDNLLCILCRITDESVRNRVDHLIITLLNRKDRERYINQANGRDETNTPVKRTPLQYLVEHRKDLTVQQFEQLVHAGCHVGCQDAWRRTLLHSAIEASNFTLAQHLIYTHHLDPRRHDNNGLGILNDLAKKLFTEQINDFLDALWSNGKINAHDVNLGHDGQDRYDNFRNCLNANLVPWGDPWPLRHAIREKNNAYIQWLLEHGAVFNMENTTQAYYDIHSLTTTPEEERFCKSLYVLQEKTVALYREQSNTPADHVNYPLLKNKVQWAEKSFDHLTHAFIFYLTTPDKTPEVVEKFHNDCLTVLSQAELSDLTQHRGWANIYQNIAIHLALLVTTAGFGNLASMGYNYWQSGGKTMFFQSDTASMQSIKSVTTEAEHLAKKSNNHMK